MSRFLALTKQLLKNTFKPTFADQKEKRKYIITIVAIAIGFGLPYILVCSSSYTLFEVAVEHNMLTEILSTMFLSGQIATMFLTLFAYVNIMFFSKDNEFLFTLPIKNTMIFWSKLIVVLVLEIIFSAFILLPMLVISAIAVIASGVTVTAGYFIMAILAIILLPFMAILIIALLSYPLMAILKFFKKRPMLGAILTIILVVGFYIAIYTPILLASGSQELPSGVPSGDITDTGEENVSSEEELDELFVSLMSPFSKLGRYSFHTYFLAKSMTSASMLSSFGYAMAFIGIVLILALIGTVFASLLYRKISAGLLEDGQQTSSKKANSKIVQLGASKALLKKEFVSVFKNTTLFIQAGMMLLLTPLLIFFLGKMSNSAVQGTTSAFMAVGISEMLIKIMSSSSNIAVIAISREGEGIFALKTYPVQRSLIVDTKIKLANYFSLATIIMSTIAVFLTGNANVIDCLAFLAGNIMYSFAMNRYSVYRDLKRPKIHWKNIVEITNNNMASVIPMLISMVGGIALIAVCALLSFLPINSYLISLIYFGITMLVSVVYYFPIKATTKDNVDNLFDAIE